MQTKGIRQMAIKVFADGANLEGMLDMYENGNVQEIGRASLGKECRSRWSPYH